MNTSVQQNEIVQALLKNQDFLKGIGGQLAKADTITQGTGLVWYDLSPVVQLMYPFKELIPLISRLPRVPANGGTAHHWKRITGVNINKVALGVSEGNRGARIAVTEQDQMATYKTLGLESDTTFEARLGAKNLTPTAQGIAVQSTLRSVMVGEEQMLILGNAGSALGTTPTPTLSASGSGSSLGTITAYVRCVALSGFGWLGTTTYNGSSLTGGVPGQITKANADGSSDTFGGGSGQPSAEASTSVTSGNYVTASVTPVPGAVAYAWYIGSSSGGELYAGTTQSNKVIFSKIPSGTQPITALQVSSSYQDNSTNSLGTDGILSQIFGNPYGSAYSTSMGTNPNLPGNVTTTNGGSLVYTAATGNTGLTISGTNIAEFDEILQAAYDQYKVGFSRILMSSQDIANFIGTFFGSGDTAAQFRILFDADAATGRIVAGRRVTSYLNKFFGNTLDIDIHPFVPPGTVIFWSDRIPYELSGVSNILEAKVRQDYYQIEWPLRSRRYEYGVYVDEIFVNNFTPGFAAITNLNSPSGTVTF